PPSPTPPIRHDARRVLVVDDDPSVREMTTRMLRSEGHEVRTAATVAEARRILEDPAVPLDALLTDVVLGPERGTELISICRGARPQARIVLMSGYTPDVGAARLLASGDAAFLPKPFSRDGLLTALRGSEPLLAARPSPIPPA